MFIDRLRSSHVDPSIIDTVANVNAYDMRLYRDSVQRDRGAARAERTVWYIFPSHPVWHRGAVAAKVREFWASNWCQTLWKLSCQAVRTDIPMPRLRVGWKNQEIVFSYSGGYASELLYRLFDLAGS